MTGFRTRHRLDRIQQSLRLRVIYPIRDRLTGVARANRDDLLLIHIPKTAGTSVHRALGIPDRGHIFLSEFSNRRRREATRIIFATRDPFDRLVSTYLYMRRKGELGSIRGRPVLNLGRGKTFEEYLADPKLAAAIRDHYFYRPQFAYLRGIDAYRDKLVALRSTHLADDMEAAFGVRPDHLNRAPAQDKAAFDTIANRSRVRALYRDDYERLPTLLDACGIERPDWMD